MYHIFDGCGVLLCYSLSFHLMKYFLWDKGIGYTFFELTNIGLTYYRETLSRLAPQN